MKLARIISLVTLTSGMGVYADPNRDLPSIEVLEFLAEFTDIKEVDSNVSSSVGEEKSSWIDPLDIDSILSEESNEEPNNE